VTDPIDTYIEANSAELVEDLRRLVRQPSVAAEGRGIRECAELLLGQMRSFGMAPELIEGAGPPVIYARVPGAGERTLLLYGHYDVQPATPAEWEFDPWGAEIHDGRMYGRGTVDNKGAVMAALQGVRAYLATGTPLPVSVAFLIEGEEEIGSPNLAPFLREHAQKLRADALVNFDDNVWPDGRPRVVSGVKGTVRVRIEARRPREFHSMMAPLVENALWRLAAALGTLRAPDGSILIDGFYDDVRPPTPAELAAIRALPWDGADVLRISGQRSVVGGLAGSAALERLYLQPGLNITGLEGGYVRPMAKSVVPSFGAAELDFQTVPNQSAARIMAALRSHLYRRGFDDLHLELIGDMGWLRAAVDGPIAGALGAAIRAVHGVEPARQPTYPGYGPEPLFAELLGIHDQAFSGFGPTEDRLHAPDEYIRVADYLAGARVMARLIREYARAPRA
jgi:acetylornithine deacetylase/succinyl-diaminopimelate desuccinylase-like protein